MRDGGDLVFALRLASHLRLTLRGVLDMSAAEFAVWLAFYRRFGFDVDRLEWSTAIAGGAVSGEKPADLIPVFTDPDPVVKRRRMFDWLDTLTPEKFGGEQ